MKSFLLLSSCLLLFFIGHAQSGRYSFEQHKGAEVVNYMLQLQQHNTNDLSKGMRIDSTMHIDSTAHIDSSECLMAQSTYDVSGKMDSVHLKYKKYSHSRFDLNMLLFQYNYPYRTTPMINFGGATTTPQVKADTMRHWSLDPFTLGFGLFESGYATYSSAGNLLTYKDAFEDTLTYQSFYYNNSFNANNQISKGNWFQIRGGHNDSMNRQFFHYNASNQLIVDSIQTYRGGVWKKSTLTKYTYSGGDLTQIHCFGNLSDSTFDSILPEQLSYINNYDVQHRLINVLTSNYDGHGMVQTVKDTFDYTDTLTYHSSWRQHVWDAINHHWTPWMKMTKNITSQGLPDSTFIYSWDSSGVRWLPHTLDVTHFNHYRDPDTLKDWEYSFGSFPTAVTYTSYYYYKAYQDTSYSRDTTYTRDTTNDTVGIAEIGIKRYPVLIYPNPSSDQVFIDMGNNEACAFVHIYDAEGRKVMTFSVADARKVLQFSIAPLPQGLYWMHLENTNAVQIAVQSIRKN